MMTRIQKASAISLAIFMLSSCGTRATVEDKKRLATLEDQFGQRYEFSLESEIYLNARCRTPEPPTREEAEGIYRAYWLTEENVPRTDTAFVYLNIYDSRRVFQFQIYWDRQARRPAYSRQDHY